MNDNSRWSRILGKLAACAGMAMIGGLIAAAPASAAPAPAPVAAAGPAFEGWICQDSPIPAGHVAVATGAGCGTVRMYLVRPVTDSTWACQTYLGPPAGYVIVAYGRGCDTLNTWLLRVPQDNMWICSTHFPLPSGFVTTAGRSSSACNGWSWLIRRA